MLFSSRCSGSLDVLSTVPCSFVTTAELSPSLTQPRVGACLILDPLLGLQGIVFSLDCLVALGNGVELGLEPLLRAHRLVVITPDRIQDDDREEHDARDDGGHAPRTLAPLLLRLGGSRTP